MKRKMLLLTLALPVILCQDLHAQTSSRLVASSDYSSNGASLNVNDSTSYTYYSSSRGGDLTHTMKYDVKTSWNFVGDTAFMYNMNYLQTFDGNNNILSTIAQVWGGTGWVNSTNALYTYNSSNQLISIVYQTWTGGAAWTNTAEDVYSYNTAGQLYLDQYNTWNTLTSSFLPTSQKIYYYDGTGRLIQEVDQSYNSGSGLYNYTSQVLYTYSLITNTTTYSSWSGSAFVNTSMYTDTYDSSGDLLTDLYQTFNGSAWVNQVLHVYSGFTSTMPSVEIDQTWDTTGGGTWNNVIMYMYSYNGFGQMTSSVGESWNVGGFWEFAAGDPTSYYYYASYTAAVKTVVANNGSANLYPVPAQNILHIDLNWNEAQSASIGMYDMTGREVSKMSVPFGAQFNGAISVNNLADGLYVIRIDGTQGQIVKQVVVAH
jgi:hypothetical protein